MHKGLHLLLLLAATGLVLTGLAGFLLTGCFQDSPSVGGSTETETGTAQLTGEVRWPDGRPAIAAHVRLRRTDFLAGSLPEPVRGGTIMGDAVTDAAGRYTFLRVRIGEYQVEALYSEGYGAVANFSVPAGVSHVDMEDLILQSIVNVTGRVRFSDSSLGPASVHVLGTEHRALADSATGLFTLREMPPGVFDLRVTTPVPFFPAKGFHGQVVEGSATVPLGDLVLDKGSKQDFSLADGKLALAGIDGSNPVLYDNDFCTNTWDNEILWAVASLGRVDLRGNLVTLTQAISPEILSSWVQEARRCRLAGMRNIPEPILGASRKLALPPSGRWQDIVPVSNPGIALLVSEARKASVAKPLVVISGGELTTVAQALLLDPYIADKMVVFGVYNNGSNAKDSLASYLVARKGRFVEWGRDYFWSGPDPSASPLPGNRLGLELAASRDTTALAQLFFADFSVLGFLLDRQAWRSARGAKVLAPPLKTSLEATGPFDFIDIPAQANDWAVMDRVFFGILTDSGAYHPWPIPGPVSGVSFRAMSGATVEGEGEGEIVAGIGPGAWLEYAVDAASEGTYDLVLRNRCNTQASVRVDGQDTSSRADLELPAGSGWVETRTRQYLRKGAQSIRIKAMTGACDLSQLRWEQVP